MSETWVCENGHEMKTEDLVGQGHPPGCPRCANEAPGAGSFPMRRKARKDK